MPYIRATQTDHTKPARIPDLMRAANGSAIDGWTIVGFNPKAYTNIQYGEMQHDPFDSAATKLFIGGSDVDSTHYGRVLQRGEVKTWFPTAGNSIRLGNWFVTFEADGGVLNLQVEIM